MHTGIHTSIYPGRKLGPGVSTLPGEIVKPDLKQVIVCGIIAYTGIQPAIPVLLNGPKRLEYRRYDSVGVTVALENALKRKEVSYIHAEGYHAARLKHGPIVLREENVPVIAMLNDDPGKDKMLGNVAECRARNAPILGVVTRGDKDVEGEVDEILKLPAAPQHTTVVPAAATLQLFAYHVARLRGHPHRPAEKFGEERDGGVGGVAGKECLVFSAH